MFDLLLSFRILVSRGRRGVSRNQRGLEKVELAAQESKHHVSSVDPLQDKGRRQKQGTLQAKCC